MKDGRATEVPKKIAIVAVSQFGKSPSIAFNEAKAWFTRAIVNVAAGFETSGSVPRIAPLVDKPEFGEHGTTRAELDTLAREIESMTRRLRPPLSESYVDLMDMMDRAIDAGKDGDIGKINDVMKSFGEMFGKPKEDEYGLGLNDWKGDDE